MSGDDLQSTEKDDDLKSQAAVEHAAPSAAAADNNDVAEHVHQSQHTHHHGHSHSQSNGNNHGPESRSRGTEDVEEDAEEEEEEEEDEPKLKYAKLTGNLANVYRNGDSTSTFLVAGDKMIVGTHSGSIHVFSIPTFQSLRTYRAHQASVTSISVSPTPPPPTLVRTEGGGLTVLQHSGAGQSKGSDRKGNGTLGTQGRARQQAPVVANTPSNNIYIATSSLDGHVCVQSLVNSEDVQLRNFARPVNAVALSPDYKNDRTYLSGGLAGNLILTVGGKTGASVDANTNSTAAAASGWLGAIGLGGGNTGRDQILRSGEGAISTIKWSGTGKWIAWINEKGIKVMRSHLKLGENGDDAWKGIAHAATPNKRIWEEMAGVWKGRCEWIDDAKLEVDETGIRPSSPKISNSKKGAKGDGMEKLVVGWGDTAWLLHVHSSNATNASGKRQVGSADIIHKLHFVDCVISGISFFTPTLLAVLAYRTRDDDDNPVGQQTTAAGDQQGRSERKGRKHRHTGLAPQLRLVNVVNGEEVDLDELENISRYEALSSGDYHLGTAWFPPPPPVVDKAGKEAAAQKGALSSLEGIWDAASGAPYVSRMFSSAASVRSNGSSNGDRSGSMLSGGGKTGSILSGGRAGSMKEVTPTPEAKRKQVEAHPYMLEAGLKMFIVSPYDCVLAVRRELKDHLSWLLEHNEYEMAWGLVDKHPEAVVSVNNSDVPDSRSGSPARSLAAGSSQGYGQGQGESLAEFFADNASANSKSSRIAGTGTRTSTSDNAQAEKEKRRIGQLWLAQLIANEDWKHAGEVAGKVLGNSKRWEHWVLTFAQHDKFDEITPYIPAMKDSQAILPSRVYELVLGHYIYGDCERLVELLEKWDPELFEVRSVVSAIEERLGSEEIEEDGKEWRVLMECLAKLYAVEGRGGDALRCWVRLKDGERVMELVKGEKLLSEAVEDVPGLIRLRVTREMMESGGLEELEEGSREVIGLLAEEARRGAVESKKVVGQLRRKGDGWRPFLFFYFQALWSGGDGDGDGVRQGGGGGGGGQQLRSRRRRLGATTIDAGHALVDEFADLALSLFAEYDRGLLMRFLEQSEKYSYEKATEVFTQRHYIPELVHVLSKTGETKRALLLIIKELDDVEQAIRFAGAHPDLWTDLLDYSMDKPGFIRGLLEKVGAVELGDGGFDPIDVVRRIPEGLEVEGLKGGLGKFVREFEIQLSISEGVARVLRGEVAMSMEMLRDGRRKGVRFEVVREIGEGGDLLEGGELDEKEKEKDGDALLSSTPAKRTSKTTATGHATSPHPPGHCVGCGEAFQVDEKEILLGFACGHVYHLTCLVDANPEIRDTPAAKDLLVQMETVALDNEDVVGVRSVGAKVAHAEIIRNVLGLTGCVVCQELGGDVVGLR